MHDIPLGKLEIRPNWDLIFIFWMNSIGLSKLVDSSIGVVGQPRHVELEVCDLAATISGTATLSQSMER